MEKTCFDGQRQGSTVKQTQITISMDLRNSYQYSKLQCQNWTESYEEVQKKIINSHHSLAKQ